MNAEQTLELTETLVWPVVVLTIFLLLRGQIKKLFDRDEMTIEVAGMRISVGAAAKKIGSDLADLTQRVASIESRADGVGGALKSEVETSERIDVPKFDREEFSILWVDDFPQNNAFLVEKFNSDGIEVELKKSTHDALEELKIRKFDIIISDLGRIERGVDNPFAGLDLLKKLEKSNMMTPVVVYAGKRGLENETKLKNSGAMLVTNSPSDVMAFVEHHRRLK